MGEINGKEKMDGWMVTLFNEVKDSAGRVGSYEFSLGQPEFKVHLRTFRS